MKVIIDLDDTLSKTENRDYEHSQPIQSVIDKLGEMRISELKLAQDVKNVLVVDDVIFTGTTLNAVMEKIAENQQVTNIVNAFLYKNIHTPVDVSANYCYAAEYDGNAHWLVFPWEKA